MVGSSCRNSTDARNVRSSVSSSGEPVTYQVVLHSTRSPTVMAVAVVETFDRLHPLAAPRDANAVGDRIEHASTSDTGLVRVPSSFSENELKMVTIQFDPSDDGCTLTPIAC